MNPLKTIPDLLKEPVRSIEYGFIPTSIQRYPITWIQLDRSINVIPNQVVWLLEIKNGKVRISRPLVIEDVVGTRIALKGAFNDRSSATITTGNANRSWTYGQGVFNLYLLYQNRSGIYIK